MGVAVETSGSEARFVVGSEGASGPHLADNWSWFWFRSVGVWFGARAALRLRWLKKELLVNASNLGLN